MKSLFGFLASIPLQVLAANIFCENKTEKNHNEFLQLYLPDTDLFVIIIAVLIKPYIIAKVTFCHSRGPFINVPT